MDTPLISAPRLILSAPSSGCGKTTLTTGLLKVFKADYPSLTAYKCGPDLIDPTFHSCALGVHTYHLDPWYLSTENLKGMIATYGSDRLNLIEGVMGYYDGIGTSGEASTFSVAQATQSPVVLVLKAKGASNTLGALLKGMTSYRENHQIQGVIFNDGSKSLAPLYRQLCQENGLRYLGYLPHRSALEVPSRALGLVPAEHWAETQTFLEQISLSIKESIDLEGLLEIAHSAPPLPLSRPWHIPDHKDFSDVVLAVAQDEAFFAVAPESLDLFRVLGVQVTQFSPLHDTALPEGTSALWLPHGTPELFAKELSENSSMKESILSALNRGIPTVAEGNAPSYLGESCQGFPQVGYLPTPAEPVNPLTHFGYGTLSSNQDTLLWKAGDSVKANCYCNFHLESPSLPAFHFSKASGASWEDTGLSETLYCASPQIYFAGNVPAALRWMGKALPQSAPLAPMDIEKMSFAIIKKELAERGDNRIPKELEPIVMRCIHTSADFSYADNLRFSQEVLEKATEAIQHGALWVTDTTMALSGISAIALEKVGNEKKCFITDPWVVEESRRTGQTRSRLAVDHVAEELRLEFERTGIQKPVIFAIGNAPTALLRICELMDEGHLNPALVIGVPVGFVHVVEAKEMLLNRLDCPYIVARGRKGGSNIAAAICNALLYRLTRS